MWFLAFVLFYIGGTPGDYAKGQIPYDLPQGCEKVVFVDPVVPDVSRLKAKYPSKVHVVKGYSEEVMPKLLEEHADIPVIIMSHAAQMATDHLINWSGLLATPCSSLLARQKNHTLVLLGLGCGAPAISDWAQFLESLTPEALDLLWKAQQVCGLSSSDAACFARIGEYPRWADEGRLQQVATMLGWNSLPSASDFPRLFEEHWRQFAGGATIRDAEKELTGCVEALWLAMFGSVPDEWARMGVNSQ